MNKSEEKNILLTYEYIKRHWMYRIDSLFDLEDLKILYCWDIRGTGRGRAT